MIKTKEIDFICIEDDLDNSVAKAKKIYLEGGIFVYPTDTVYGFGVNPFNEDALEKINMIKGRAGNKQYILLVDSINTLSKYVELHAEKHLDFLLSIWPNPISVVLKLNKKTCALLNMENAAFRIPNQRFCQKLAGELSMPIVSTSVNRSGFPPINEPEIIKNEFASEIDGIFYSNKQSSDKPSTLVQLIRDKPELIREGKIGFNEIMEKFNKH